MTENDPVEDLATFLHRETIICGCSRDVPDRNGYIGCRLAFENAEKILESEWLRAYVVEREQSLLTEALDLLDIARCSLTDPGVVRAWAQRRRRLREKAQS